MTDFTPIVCDTSPTYTKLSCDGDQTLVTVPPVTPTQPPTVSDPNDVPSGIDPPVNPSTPAPHDPPAVDPGPTVGFFVSGELLDSPNQFAVTLCDPSDPGQLSAGVDYSNTSWLTGSNARVSNLMVSEDALNCWHLSYTTVLSSGYLVLAHWDMTDPVAPVKSYEYNIFTEIGGVPGLGRILTNAFYSDNTQRIYITYHITDGSKNGVAIYDVSNVTANPTLISNTVLAAWGTFHDIFGIELSYDEAFIFTGALNSGGTKPCVHAASISADGLTVTHVGTVDLGVTGSPLIVHLRRVDPNNLLVTDYASSGKALSSIDISTPASMSVRDTLFFPAEVDASTVPGNIAISSDNTRAYVYLSTNGTGPAIGVVDISDLDNLTLLSNYLLYAGIAVVKQGDVIHYVESDRALSPYLISMIGAQSIDVSNDLALAKIDDGAFPNQAENIGCPKGPKSFRFGSDVLTAINPTPVDANLAVVSGSSGSYGIAAIVGLDDYTTPTLPVVVRETALYNSGMGPYVAFTYDGHIALLGATTLQIYATGAAFALVGTLVSSSFSGATGLIASKRTDTLWVTVGNTLIEIDITDPTTPTISSSADIGPSYYDGVAGDATIYGLTDAAGLIIEQDGPGLVAQADGLRSGWTRPIELVNCKKICLDATYAYVWNDYNGGGLAVFKYGVATLDFVGYYHNGTRSDSPSAIVKNGNFVYVLHSTDSASAKGLTIVDVTTPSSPSLEAEYSPGTGGGALAVASSTEVVIIGRTITRLNVTTPASPTVTASLATGRILLAGAISNGKLVAFDNSKHAISYSLGASIVEEDILTIISNGDREAFGFSVAGLDYVVVGHSNPSSSQPVLTVINVTTVGAITEASHLNSPGTNDAWGFDTTTRKGVVPGYGVDLTNPNAPLRITPAYNPSQEYTRSVGCAAMTGSTLVVGRLNSVGGIAVADASDLSNIVDVRGLGDLSVSKRVRPGKLYHIRGTNNGIAIGYNPFRICAALVTNGEPRIGAFTNMSPPSIIFGGAALEDSGNYLFVAYRNSGLGVSDWGVRVFDVSTPSAVPAALSAYMTQREITSIHVSGTSYVVLITYKSMTGTPMLAIIDFSDLYSPVLLGEIEAYATVLTNQGMEIY